MTMELRHAIRLLLSQRGFTAAVVLTLGLGIGAATAAYALVDAVLLEPLPYPDGDRIVSVTVRGRGGDSGIAGGVLDAVRRLPSIERAAASVHTEQNLVTPGELAIVRGAMVTSEFFDVFKAAPLAGRTLGAGPSSSDEIVLGERLWRQRFAADPQIVGRTIRLDDRLLTVVGVMRADFAHLEEASYWRPFEMSAGARAELGSGPFTAVARTSSAGVAAARAEADALSAALKLTVDRQEPAAIALTPLLQWMTDVYRRTLLYALAAVGLVLLIACGNAAHLVLTRTLGRAQELAVRTAIGATRTRILWQLLIESSVLAAASGVAGIALAWLMIRAIPSIALSDMPRLSGLALDGRVLTFAVAVCAATVVFTGLCPAWLSRSARTPLQAGRGTSARTARRTAAVVVTVEVAFTLMLVLCGGLATATLLRRLNVDVGFDPRSLSLVTLRPSLTTYAGGARGEYYQRVTEAVRAAPGIEAVAGASHAPIARLLAANAPVSTPGAGGRPLTIGARARMMAPGSFAALRVSIVKGRDFDTAEKDGTPLLALVNASLAARLWRGEDPIGKVVTAPAFTAPGVDTYRVIGVVGNFRGSLLREPGPELYVSALQRPPRQMHLMIRSRLGPRDIDRIVRDAIGTVDREQPAAAAVSMNMLFRDATEFNRFSALWLTSFASFALVLAVGGILATVMRAVVTRTQELGIRAAIGATPAQQVRLVMRDLLLPVAVGSALGLAGTYNMSTAAARFMAIDRIETAVSMAAVLVVAVAAGLAAWIPARRAAHIDPVRALQQE
jgi:putative ABC transport system permease protein